MIVASPCEPGVGAGGPGGDGGEGGEGGDCTSKAPTSTVPLKIRTKPAPRSSVVTEDGTRALLPVSMATLPDPRAWVSVGLLALDCPKVGPPLSCSGPRFNCAAVTPS